MKKTVITLSTLAGLATLGANANHADAAAYTIDEVNNGQATQATQATQTVQAPVSNQSYSYTYVVNEDGSRTYNYSNGYTASSYVAPVAQTAAVSETAEPAVSTAAPVAKKAAAVTTSVNNNVASVARSIAAGKSYVYGANSASAVDCSAFAQQVLAAMGKSIPRTTYAQMAAGTPVSTPQPGDLVYFNGGSHVGVYIGNGQMIDALNPSAGIGQRAVSYINGSVTGYYRF
ncbi:NlpC/P60 family protein [Macrococcus brunensis]|uniref:NlpC/P60 family protein n=1 Tax=Macrococcus brunensis TaxID=198483 RepID=A0A4R6BGZ2_9STAP|nr:C40 family peptidase [Macrococcus brunensis]TDL99043.1 NlpC/P60 family protein [Macrococcus brunensis]